MIRKIKPGDIEVAVCRRSTESSYVLNIGENIWAGGFVRKQVNHETPKEIVEDGWLID